jgi:hypothetical protein
VIRPVLALSDELVLLHSFIVRAISDRLECGLYPGAQFHTLTQEYSVHMICMLCAHGRWKRMPSLSSASCRCTSHLRCIMACWASVICGCTWTENPSTSAQVCEVDGGSRDSYPTTRSSYLPRYLAESAKDMHTCSLQIVAPISRVTETRRAQ